MKIGLIAWGMAQTNIATQDCKLRSDSAGFEVRGLFSRGGCFVGAPVRLSFPLFFSFVPIF